MNKTEIFKMVAKGICRCGCGMDAQVLNAQTDEPKWVGVEYPQGYVNIFKPHYENNAFGEALNFKTNNKKTSTHAYTIKARVRLKAADTARRMSLAMRQSAWATEYTKSRDLVFTARLDAKQEKTLASLARYLNGRVVKWYLDGKQMPLDEINEILANKNNRHINGLSEIQRLK